MPDFQEVEREEITNSDEGNSADKNHSSSSHLPRPVAQQPQSNQTPITIVGFNKSDGHFSGHVLCPKNECTFRYPINQPQHSYIRFATIVIAAHLKCVHGIENSIK